MYEHLSDRNLRYDNIWCGGAPVSIFYRRGLSKTRKRHQSFRKPSKWPRAPKPRPYRVLVSEVEA
jgi:hypothetical protein